MQQQQPRPPLRQGGGAPPQPRSPPPSSSSAASSPHAAAGSFPNAIQSACAVLHDLHTRATPLVHEAEACIASMYSSALTANAGAVVPSHRKTQDTTASLLRRCSEMQDVLSLVRHGTPDSVAAVAPLEKALAVLLACVPVDWQKLLAELPEAALRAGNSAAAAAAAPTPNAATAAAPAAAADGRGAAAPSPSSPGSLKGNSSGAAAGMGPGDVVQLALLLRRRWTLQRDLHLLIAALRDICTAAAANASYAGGGGEGAASPSSTPPPPPPPPLTAVSVALSVLQLSRTAVQLAQLHASAHTTSTAVDDAPMLFPYPVPSTVVPVWLWRACGAPGAGASSLLPYVPVLTPAAPAAAVLASLHAARRLTKHVFKWEARLARFASDAVVATSTRSSAASPVATAAPQQHQPQPPQVVELLDGVLRELNLEHGACNDVQLLWLTIAAAAADADAADVTRSPNARAVARHAVLGGADVVKRCGKLERTLRTLWPASAIARALLPGVLLLLGSSYAARPQGHVADAASPSAPAAVGKQLPCWTEAYTLGRQVLGAAHPVVETAAALVTGVAPASPVGSAGLRMATFSRSAPPSQPSSTAAAAALLPRDSIATTMSSRASSDPYLHFQASAALHAAAPQRLPAGTLTRPLPLPPVAIPTQQQQQHQLPPGALPPRPPASAPPAPQLASPSAVAASRTARPPSLLPSFAQTAEHGASLHSASQVSAGPAMQLARTFPVPSIASSSGGAGSNGASAAKAGSVAASNSNDAAVSHPSLPRRPSPQPGAKLSGRDALRRCYRLQNPADAFVLRSAVKDASLRASTGADGEKKKSKKKGEARGNRDGKSQPSTAALLLSAISPRASVGGVPGSPRGADSGSLRKKKKDRKLLLMPSPRSTAATSSAASPRSAVSVSDLSKKERGDGGSNASVAGAAASECGAASSSQQQQLQVHDVDYDGPPRDLGATAQGIPASAMQIAGNGNVSEGASNPAAARSSTIALSPSTRGSLLAPGSGSSGRPSGVGQQPGEGHARARIGSEARASNVSRGDDVDDDSDEDEDEEDEEEEEAETLPERNARFQREVVGFYAELNERRGRAALVIQLAWRSSKAREQLHLRRQVLYRYMYTIQKAAALAIDGFVAGVREQRRRRAALRARANADERRRQQERREVAAAQTLTRAVRQWLVRQEERRRLCKELSIAHDARLRLYAATAVTVQRWWRRIVVEKAYWRRRTVEVAEQRRREAEAARQANAATCIQRRVRGVQTRMWFSALRERRRAEAAALQQRRDAATTVLAIVLQEYAQRRARLEREAAEQEACEVDAAARIAGSWRRTMERRRFHLALTRARELRVAATCLQRAWRRHAAGQQRRYLRAMRQTMQAERLASEARTYEAARLLQCCARSAMDQLLVRRLKARHGRTFMENVILLQSIGRGVLGRVEAGRMWSEEQARKRAAAAALAALQLRAMHLTQSLLQARVSATLVQARRRRMLTEKLTVRTTASREMREDAAATVLQRAERRRQQRVRDAAAAAEAAAALAFLGAMAERLQRAWRCWRARQARRDRAAAVAQCARKRVEREEVWRLIWQDQLIELEVTCLLERQYIAERQHQGRIRLYALLCNPNAAKVGLGEVETYGDAVDGGDDEDAFRPDAGVIRWAALYDE